MESINYGDRVLVYIDEKRRFLVRVEKNGILGTDKGFIKHDDMVGRRYGSTIETSQGYKAYLYRPLPIDYQYTVKRKTQIIYPKDLSYMIFLSGIKPGSRILEAGVGTGYTTICLAYFVGENQRPLRALRL
jgi:tRNA (adenine57-N1/adenine58-N1)-methyltransferase